MKQRLDTTMVQRGMAETRSAANNWIQLGRVKVGGRVAHKSGLMVDDASDITLDAPQRYVSRAGLKLASVANTLFIQFADKIVLDVGSSTGGFTDYALQNGASKVYAVDVGTDQLHPSLRTDPRIELHEKTDIRDFQPAIIPDVVLADVSFISLKMILPHIAKITDKQTDTIVMVKPQFEARRDQLTKTGIVKNDRFRRDILQDFEQWTKRYFVIADKADSEVAGAHGNRERFYKLRRL